MHKDIPHLKRELVSLGGGVEVGNFITLVSELKYQKNIFLGLEKSECF